MPLRMLIAEDEFSSRMLLVAILRPYGESDVAVDGREAVKAVQDALADNQPYDLICLDIMMPNLDGQATLKEIRRLEIEHGIQPGKGAKVIMTTALYDAINVMAAFKTQCEAYLVKPIQKSKLMEQLRKFGLRQDEYP